MTLLASVSWFLPRPLVSVLSILNHQGSCTFCKACCWGQSWDGGHETLSRSPYIKPAVPVGPQCGLSCEQDPDWSLLLRVGIEPTSSWQLRRGDTLGLLPVHLHLLSLNVFDRSPISKNFLSKYPQYIFTYKLCMQLYAEIFILNLSKA